MQKVREIGGFIGSLSSDGQSDVRKMVYCEQVEVREPQDVLQSFEPSDLYLSILFTDYYLFVLFRAENKLLKGD